MIRKVVLSIFLSTVMAFLPVMSDMAVAQEVQARRPIKFTVTEHASSRAATFEVIDTARKLSVKASLRSASGNSGFVVDGSGIVFDDGYALQSELLSNTDGVIVRKIVAISPSGKRETAIVRMNVKTDGISGTGLEGVRTLLATSEGARVAQEVMPALLSEFAQMSRSRALAGDGGTGADILIEEPWMYDEGVMGCIGAVLAFVAATIGFILACGVPEPFEPVACAGAFIAWQASVFSMLDSCQG